MRWVLRSFAGAFFVFVSLVFSCIAVLAQTRPLVRGDSVSSQLAAMGEPGITIAVVREEVLEILQSENSCSAWFREVDSNPAATFASLRFILDTNGPAFITGHRTEYGDQFFMHPYSASVAENAGRHAIITLNAHGAFFNSASAVLEQDQTGSIPRHAGWRPLLVETYPGNTLPARMTTLLHELGHVVGRIPDDSDERSGQSGRNTAEVLRFCRAQIKASMRSDHFVVISVGD